MTNKKRLSWLAVYTLYFLSCGAVLGVMLLARQMVFVLADVGGADREATILLDRLISLGLGIAALVFIVYLEHYYREGMNLSRFPERIVRSMGNIIAVLFIIQIVMEIAIGFLPGRRLALILLVLELSGAVILLATARKLRERRRDVTV